MSSMRGTLTCNTPVSLIAVFQSVKNKINEKFWQFGVLQIWWLLGMRLVPITPFAVEIIARLVRVVNGHVRSSSVHLTTVIHVHEDYQCYLDCMLTSPFLVGLP